MILRIEVSGELEAALTAKAGERGLPIDDIARGVWEEVLTPLRPENEPNLGLAGEAKAQAFVRWAAGHRDTPLLSDEAVSRASLYQDRW